MAAGLSAMVLTVDMWMIPGLRRLRVHLLPNQLPLLIQWGRQEHVERYQVVAGRPIPWLTLLPITTTRICVAPMLLVQMRRGPALAR
ncbi:hypothetical protein D3C81_1720060 [compost metagenome]